MEPSFKGDSGAGKIDECSHNNNTLFNNRSSSANAIIFILLPWLPNFAKNDIFIITTYREVKIGLNDELP